MIKKWIYYTSLAGIVTFITLSFKPLQTEKEGWFHTEDNNKMLFHFPSINQDDYVSNNIPFTGKFFIAYKEALAFKESQGKYKKVNTLGYMGKYQFGKSTLQSIGVYDHHAFINNPKMQERAFIALLAKNKYELRDVIKKYDGKVVRGILITESGILAAAHLGGVGSVKKYFRSNGRTAKKDSYGTSIESYMKKFAGYETASVAADKNAKVSMRS